MIAHPGLRFRSHTVAVPVDHRRPGGATIEVFAREMVAADRAGDDLPWLLFLQGGPGGKSPRPLRAESWLARAVQTHRVLLLDQRGTGRSTPVTARTVRGMPAEQLAAYLKLFRADSIVADAEILRERVAGGATWDTLGQSYGGFITMAYLSTAPEGLRTCYVTGGLPGLTTTADEVYARTYPRVAAKNAEFYRAFPGDAAAVRRMADHLAGTDVRLPDGDRLTVGRLRVLGNSFGMSYGYAQVHWPILFDRSRLASNEVPVHAAVYADDMYVDAGLSLQTAASVGNLRVWVTNEHEHDGLRTSGESVLSRLMDMAAGRR